MIRKTYIPAKPRNKKLIGRSIPSSNGVAAGGGGSTGGGLTPEQIEILSFWKKDPDNPNTIFTEMNAYSKLELSAYGVGDGGGGGSGIIETVYGYGNLGQTFNNSILTDTFNAYTINSIHERVQVLEAGGGGGGSDVEWGTLTNGYRQLTVEGVTYALAQNTHKHLWADITDKPSTFTPSAHSHAISDVTGLQTALDGKSSTSHSHSWSSITSKPSTFTPSAHSHGWSEITGKPSTFTPSAHTHSAGDITSGTFAIAMIPTGTTSSTVALGNHTHSWSSITSKPSTFAPSAHTHLWADITDKPSTFTPSAHTHSASDITSGTFAIARIPTGTTGTTVALGNHLHTGVYEPVFSKNTAFNKNFGTAAGTVAEGNDSRIVNGQTAFGWGNHASAGYALNSSLSGYLPLTGGTLTGNLTAPTFIGSLTGNADTATKLQTARTIAGVSFDGTENIAIPFANLSSKPDTLGGYGITDAVTLNTAQTITGGKTFNSNIILTVGNYLGGTDTYAGVWNIDNKLWRFGSSSTGSVSNIRSEKVGVGTDTPTQKLHVVGNILATGATTTPKVIFNSAGWSMEQTGTELLLKYNNLIAARFLSDGSIVGLGEITAYGGTTGGEGVSLLRTGGTMTGPIRWSTQSSNTPFIGRPTDDAASLMIALNSTTWQGGLTLGGTSGNLLWKGSQVLDKANTANKIEMGNGWTIEQTTSALTIKKNGVVKETFNA